MAGTSSSMTSRAKKAAKASRPAKAQPEKPGKKVGRPPKTANSNKPGRPPGRPPKTAREKRQPAQDAPKRVFNSSTAKDAIEKKKRQHEIFGKALKYCRDNNCGAKKCLSAHPEWKEVISLEQLKKRLTGEVAYDADAEFHVQADKALLTTEEEASLVEWLVACNEASDAKTHDEIGRKVREILVERRDRNRRGEGHHVPFNKPQHDVICGTGPSRSFFTGFFARNAEKLGTKVQKKTKKTTRTAVNWDEAVEEYFKGITDEATGEV